jgi:hypothetical protein
MDFNNLVKNVCFYAMLHCNWHPIFVKSISKNHWFFLRPDTDSESDEEGVAGPLGQLRGVEDSSDSDSDLMPQPRYI